MIETPDQLTFAKVCYAFNLARTYQEQHRYSWAERGLHLAKNRNPLLLKVMEEAAEVMVQEEENQRRESMRTTDVYAEQRYTTETQMWREAYRMVDEGKAEQVQALMWIYGAGAFLAGLQL